MSEDRLNRLENALTNLAEKFTEFIRIESARQERDKHQLEINTKLLKHIETFNDEFKPTILRSKRNHKFFSNFLYKVVAPAILLAVLSAAGYKFL